MTRFLEHLLPCPPEFRDRLRIAETEQELLSLSRYALDTTQLELLERRISKHLCEEIIDLQGLSCFKLGLVSNATLDITAPSIRASGYRHGLRIETVMGEYGQVVQQAIDPGSKLNKAQCDAVWLAIDMQGLSVELNVGESHDRAVAEAIEFLSKIQQALKATNPTAVIFQTLPQPLGAAFGSLDFQVDGTERAFIADFNSALRTMVKQSSGDYLFDVEKLASLIGLHNWHDAPMWHLAKLPFAPDATPVVADHMCRLVGAMRGRSKKC